MANVEPGPETGKIPNYLLEVDLQWEAQRDLRQRCANGGALMVNPRGQGGVLGNLASAKANVAVLSAITGRMAAHGILKAAPVDVYSNMVLDFYVAANYPKMSLAPSLAHQDAWGIKRCLSFLRRKWMRNEVCRDAWHCL